MIQTQTIKLALSDIDVRDRLREFDADHAKALQDSIAEVGLLEPIVVTGARAGDTSTGCPLRLVAGAHRFAACAALGWSEIPALVATYNEHEAIIAECDENLLSAKLTPAQRARLTVHRKRAYEALHPETKHGAIGNGRKGRQIGDSTRFSADLAARSRRSERAIQRDAQRGEAIDPAVLREVQGTPLDKSAVLDQLAKVPKDRQPAKLIALAGVPSAEKQFTPPADGEAAQAKRRRAAEEAAAWLGRRIGVAALAELADMLQEADAETLVNAVRTAAIKATEARPVRHIEEPRLWGGSGDVRVAGPRRVRLRVPGGESAFRPSSEPVIRNSDVGGSCLAVRRPSAKPVIAAAIGSHGSRSKADDRQPTLL